MSDEDEAAAAGALTAARKRNSSSNDAALLLKLSQLTGGIDPEASDKAWLETLSVTAHTALDIDDPDDDLKRELAFYNQALAAVKAAQARMDRLGVPYRRPDDYFAEMAKSDAHMTKVKRRMLNEHQAVVAAEERRKQRTAKKFGKQVQTAKLQERAQQRKAAINEVASARKARKGNPQAPEFDIELDDGPAGGGTGKRARGGGDGGFGAGGSGKRLKGGITKREHKEERFGKSHLRRDKRNSAESSSDMRDFNRDRGSKSARGGGKGKGGGRGGGGRGGGRGGKARPGKERRLQSRNQ